MTVEILGKGKQKQLFCDGQFVCLINDFLILKYKLPTELSSSKLNEIKNEAECELGFSLAVDYVAKGSKTQKQVLEFLLRKISEKNALVVLEKLKGYHYIDDSDYARRFIESKQAVCGKNKLKLLLLQKGVDRRIIDSALRETSTDVGAIVKLCEKYMRTKKPTQENLSKLSRHLLSKGYTWDEISSAVREFKEKTNESWD